MNAVYLTSAQVLAAVRELDAERLPLRTLALWAKTGLVVPSVDWPHRRRGARLYTARDLGRVRLVVQLRRRLSMPRVRAALAYVDTQLPDALRPGTRAVLQVDGWRASIVPSPAAAAVDLAAPGQLRLELAGCAVSRERAAVFMRAA